MDETVRLPGAAREKAPWTMSRVLPACGVVGGLLFIAVFLVEGAIRQGYDPIYHPVSALSLGDRGWIQVASFLVTGSLMIGFAAGVRRALGSTVGALLIGAFGAAQIVSGVFPMDPMRGYPPGAPLGDPVETSWQHQAHDWGGVVVFFALPVACFVISRRLTGGWRAYTLLTGVAGLALFVWFGVAWEENAANAGLIQRAAIVVDWGWVVLLALHLRRSTSHAEPR